ncbi:MAG: protein-L-isoaspartate(D-aspartate) O-methyltransferase [Bacteroidota bacterium]
MIHIRSVVLIVFAGIILSSGSYPETHVPADQIVNRNLSSKEHDVTVFQDEEWWKSKLNQMIEEQIKARGITDERLLEAIRNTPRHKFVPEKYEHAAYKDGPLPIGHGQTISQPYIVALMTDKLDLQGDEKVLEIGTGSAYQAAILSQMASEVYTIEIVEELAREATQRVDKMGYDNVHVRHGNGYKGWPEHAPFDRIIVTAAPEEIPEELIEQLAVDGKMVLPVGKHAQTLKVVTKDKQGDISEKVITGVRFVPMIHPDE